MRRRRILHRPFRFEQHQSLPWHPALHTTTTTTMVPQFLHAFHDHPYITTSVPTPILDPFPLRSSFQMTITTTTSKQFVFISTSIIIITAITVLTPSLFELLLLRRMFCLLAPLRAHHPANTYIHTSVHPDRPTDLAGKQPRCRIAHRWNSWPLAV